jgi:hypothetical protein
MIGLFFLFLVSIRCHDYCVEKDWDNAIMSFAGKDSMHVKN